ncbi:MAG TPA: DUF3108 domain-containing protein [Saprospiraceae bacterium]|nr:DUF3108 domain-containing protein [Saprospiraceae bacterium]
MFKVSLFSMMFFLGAIVPVEEVSHVAVSDSQFSQCAPLNRPFKHGEELTYKLSYSLGIMNLNAGEVVFRLEDKGDTYKLTARGKTYKGYEWFFKVRDYYETEVDKETLQPIHAIRDIKEGDYAMYEETSFENGRVKVQRGTNASDLGDVEVIDVKKCVSDVLSLLYVLRTANTGTLKKGSELPMSLFIDKEEFNLKMTYKGNNKNKKIPGLGRFKTMVFEPEVVKGTVFKGEKGMKVWVSDDANKIPMMIKSPVSVGSVKATLKSYKNLRY